MFTSDCPADLLAVKDRSWFLSGNRYMVQGFVTVWIELVAGRVERLHSEPLQRLAELIPSELDARVKVSDLAILPLVLGNGVEG
jgi:hypothetical protein